MGCPKSPKNLLIPELDSPQVHMKNKDEVYGKIWRIVEGGHRKLQVITDFDRTLSTHHYNGKNTKSSYGVFESIPTLPKEFLDGTTQLFQKFRAIEDDPKLTSEEKLPHMVEWWKSSEKLYIGMPCDENLILQAVIEADVRLRAGIESALSRLHEANVPVLVFSAGLGDIVTAILKHNRLLYDNVHVISNFFNIEKGQIAGFIGTLIHVYNKNQHAVENSSYFKDLEGRGNVILMGDSIGDANMSDGVVDQGEVIKIGFLSINVEEFLPQYLEHFDIVLTNDQTMDVFSAILNKIF